VRRISTARATLYILVAACCFGSVVILTSLAKSAGATLTTILFWRYLLGGLLLVVVARGVRRSWIGGRSAARLLVLGGGGQTLIAFLSLLALDYIPAATIAFLFYTYPTWVAVIAALRGTERMDGTRAAALVLSLAGITLMVGSPWSGDLDPTGVALALAAALIYALYIPLIGWLSRGHPPEVASAHIALGVAVILGVAGLATGELSGRLAVAAWLPIAGLAVASTAVAFVLFLRGLEVLRPVRTAIVSTIEPFWTTLLAVVALGQPFRMATLAGGALIATAVLLLQWQRTPPAPATAQ
jgi:drug/metabolite transporter (DMT)-like permease